MVQVGEYGEAKRVCEKQRTGRLKEETGASVLRVLAHRNEKPLPFLVNSGHFILLANIGCRLVFQRHRLFDADGIL
ncbi:hypothetical protein [Shouchella tritolerans]|uniref:hypothetical protein n=1 Tax=Shouchella tritolerans TaxID=2979466 RepID=UPI0021E8F302|nr:hypothetical protein [Shouchella tritolerans]